MGTLGILALLILVLTIVTWLSRAHEVFCVSFRGGRLLVVRGWVPASLQRDFCEILREKANKEVLLKGFLYEGEATLVMRAADEEQAQRLRNVFFLLSPASLSPPSRRPRRTWWRLLGFVWLAWWMEGRNEDEPSNITKFRR